MVTKAEFVYVTYIASTLERVWQGLTSPEFTRDYWGGRSITSEWQVGARVEARRPDGGLDWEGEVLRYEPPTHLSYTFCMLSGEGKADGEPSRLTFELELVLDMVKLTLTHEHAAPDSVTLLKTQHGWPAIMSSLKSLLETGRPLPFKGLGFAPGDPLRGQR